MRDGRLAAKDIEAAILGRPRRPAVYRTDPVMVVDETVEGSLLEHSLHELADVHEVLPPRLWQALVEEYQVFQVR
jgi:hypothetical protein